jgi:hypothetical protein
MTRPAQWEEIGRVTGTPPNPWKESGRPAGPQRLRIATGGGLVMVGIGTWCVWLDAENRETFTRLYAEACRKADGAS